MSLLALAVIHYPGAGEQIESEQTRGSSRNSRMTRGALRFAVIGSARWVSSNHSRIVGRSTMRSNSLLR